VTSEESPYARFRRALDRGDLFAASNHANELAHVGLAEAFELALLILEKKLRYDRAAFQLHAPLATERASALLAALSGKRVRESAHVLADLIGADRNLLPVSKVLTRWGGG